MNFKLPVTLLSAAFIFTGCGSTPPKLSPLPVVNQLALPEVPQNENLSRNIEIRKLATDRDVLFENVITRTNFKIKPNSKVVISVPVEQQKQAQKQTLDDSLSKRWLSSKNGDQMAQQALNERNALNKTPDETFKTAEYFNKAEQEIEKSLLRKNFTVLDRSKFEAELRDRRAKDSGSSTSTAKDAEIKNLEEKLAAQRITNAEYITGLQNIETKYDIFSQESTRKAGVNELVDISELIRAAQQGTIQADYILQVNSFDLGPISDRQLFVSDHTQISNLINQYPGLDEALEDAGVATITQPGYFGYLNAKLIEVKTGSIVWVGEHRVDSSNVTDIKIGLNISRQVSNDADIAMIIAKYNDAVEKKRVEAINIGRSTQYEGLDSSVQMSRLASYNQAIRELNEMISTPPELPTWQYSYNIASPSVKPSFPSFFDLKNMEKDSFSSKSANSQFLRLKQRMVKHQTDIAKIVSKELIATIPAAE
ncbi:hypothetical protein ACOYR1_05900 [Thalassotalea piscium]